MAMIDCPECEETISNKAKACPHCGFVLPKIGCLVAQLGCSLALFVPFFLITCVLLWYFDPVYPVIFVGVLIVGVTIHWRQELGAWTGWW